MLVIYLRLYFVQIHYENPESMIYTSLIHIFETQQIMHGCFPRSNLIGMGFEQQKNYHGRNYEVGLLLLFSILFSFPIRNLGEIPIKQGKSKPRMPRIRMIQRNKPEHNAQQMALIYQEMASKGTQFYEQICIK